MHDSQWPAAKYLTYAFWRSWILSVYTAPIWSIFAAGEVASSAFLSMYLFSTLAYIVVCILCAVGYRRVAGLLNRRAPMLALGVASTVGVLLEYVDLGVIGGGTRCGVCSRRHPHRSLHGSHQHQGGADLRPHKAHRRRLEHCAFGSCLGAHLLLCRS